MLCRNCGKEIPNDSRFCNFCSAPVYPDQNNQQSYGQPQQPYGQPYYGQPVDTVINDQISTARTFGIISIIAAFFFPLASWICGAIGISKVKPFLNYSDYIGEQARDAKRLCKIGIIIGVVFVSMSALIGFLFAFIFLSRTFY